MADICSARAYDLPEVLMLICRLPLGHDGPHWDDIDRVIWRIVLSRAIPRVTEAYLTPSADLPACRDEDPARAATLAACYPEDSDDT